jgi:hypothetical protein
MLSCSDFDPKAAYPFNKYLYANEWAIWPYLVAFSQEFSQRFRETIEVGSCLNLFLKFLFDCHVLLVKSNGICSSSSSSIVMFSSSNPTMKSPAGVERSETPVRCT